MTRPIRATARPASITPPRPPAFEWHAERTLDSPWLDYGAWLVMALFTAAALAMVFGPHSVGDVFTETDFYGSYGPGARRLLQGHIDASRYAVVGPLFEMLLAAVGLVVHDLFFAAELIAVGAMTLTLWCWHSLFARRAGRLVALVAVLFVASNAQFFRFAWSVTTDAPALAFQAAALWALFGARAGSASPRRVFAAGVLAGAAFLTRYNGIALLPAGVIALLLGWDEAAGEAPGGSRVRRALLFAAGFAAPIAPWLAFSLSHGGATRFQLHHNIAYEVFARPNGIVWDVYERDMEPQFPTLWSVIARDPMAVASRMLFNAFDHLRLDAQKLAGGALAVVAAAGIWFAWRDGVLWRTRGALAAMVLLFFTLVPAFHSERYSLAMLPMWALFAASLFASPRFALVVVRIPWKLALVLVVLVPSLQLTREFAARVIHQLPVEARDAALEIRPYVTPGEPVLARKPHFAWYAGLTPLTLPLSDSLSTWGDAARRMKARWLYFSWPEAEMRPAFEWLLDTTSAAPGLRVRAATAHWPAVVYEIGPEFGQEPEWIGNDTLVAVHRARARVLTNDRNVEARAFLAMHEFSLGNHDAAQVYIDQLLVMGPNDLEILILAAENRLQLQDPDGALSYYERADRVRPGTAEVRIGRGWVAAMRGDDASAAQYWAPVVSASNDPVTLQRMMLTFAHVGDAQRVNEAREALRALSGLPEGVR